MGIVDEFGDLDKGGVLREMPLLCRMLDGSF